MKFTDYHAKYFAHELTKRSAANDIQKLASTLMDAQVDLNPHQVDAALFAFKSPLSKGAILADEVGLGKTIEAGLVISQKWAERKKKILIIVPSNLRKQWYQELADKFFLPSMILETKSFNDQIKKAKLNPFDQKKIVICSYHFARAKETYIGLINWDLVIVDEAHRLRNVYKPHSKIANSIKQSIARAPKILLTATPLQNSLLELFGLVSIVDDYTFGDLNSFKNNYSRMIEEENYDDLKERLKQVCKRTLRRQVLEYIKYTNRIPLTQEFIPSEEEHRLYLLVSEYLQSSRLYALPQSQRQLLTLILRKLLASSTYAIAGTLEALYKKLEGIVYGYESPELFEAIFVKEYESYEDEKDEWQEEEPVSLKDIYSEAEINEIKEEVNKLKEFYNLAHSIEKDSKGKVLLQALERGFFEAQAKGAKNKAVIFTESRRTQKYLTELLDDSKYEGKTVLFNGSNNDKRAKEIYKQWLEKHKGTDKPTGSRTADTRAAIIEYFRDEAEIMIATEAAAEGINLQFCSLVVNYDLPWNPQRIEQRIGRCHRYGQKYDVVVVNFLNRRNAADQRVFELLSEKFKLFSGVFGASDEVLGSIESGVDFEKRIASIYQNCRTEEEIQLSFDFLQKEMEDQIDEKMKSTRQTLLENFDEEVHEKLRISLEESKIYLSKYENWLWMITKYYLQPYAQFNHEEGSFLLTENPFPDKIIHPGSYKLAKSENEANIYRIGHPLAQSIIDSCKAYETKPALLKFDYTGTPERKISILENLIGKTGWLKVVRISVCSFECEDYIILAGFSDEGASLDNEQCARMFSLPANVISEISDIPEVVSKSLNDSSEMQRGKLLEQTAERNSHFFDDEMEKLDKWAEDIKTSLEIELKQLDKDIKTKKSEAKKILKLEEKVKTQKHIKEMEKKRNDLRMKLFKSQDEVDERKEKLILDIEERLKQNITISPLFTIKWTII